MRLTNLIIILCFSYFFAENISAQKCSEKEEWIEKTGQDQSGEYNCELTREALENILEDCLLSKDSFHHSLWNLYLVLGFNYYYCGPEEKGTGYFQSALKAIRNSTEINLEDLGRIYRSMATNYYFLEKNQEALHSINQAIKYFESENSNYLSKSYQLLGNIYTEFGDYDQALLYLNKSEKISDTKKLYDVFLIKTTRANLYFKLNQFDKALKEYESAKKTLEKDGIDKNLIQYAKLHNEIGQLHFLLENYSASVNILNKALVYFEGKPSMGSENLIITYIYLADLQIELKQYDKATSTLNKAFAIVDSEITSPFSILRSELFRQSGYLSVAQEEFKIGIDNYQKAIKALVPSFQSKENENPILSQQVTGDKIRLREILNLKAEAFRLRYQLEQDLSDLEKAHETYLTLDTLITQTRQSFKAVGSKYFLQETIVPIYEEAIEVAMQLYRETSNKLYLESAHQFMGRNKSIILIEGLQNEKVKFATIPSQLIKQETQLKKAYYDWEIALYEAEQNGDFDFVQQLKDSLFSTKIAYENLIQIFEKDFPRYYQSKFDYYAEIDVDEVQSRIDSDRAVVEFFVGEKLLYVSVITKDQFDIFQSPLPENFEELCFDFIKMTRGESYDDLEERFSKKSYELYQYLFVPALEKLNPSINRLTIIPDDILLHLSFDALLTEPYSILPENWADPDLPYFIRKYAHHQVYANSLLFDEESQQRVKEATKGFLGFGIEYFDDTNQHQWTKEDSILQKRISGPLPFSDEEVLAIQALMGGQVAINEDATKDFFLVNSKDYDLLHFAMHGYADEKSPLSSALIFTKVDDHKDYLLKVADIYAMNLPASMVYLSACQTNYATLQKGEGMPTISRAFAYAGCPSVVASLWNIPDKSSKEIAIAFYENLQKKQTKDVALRNAKLSYLQNVKDINNALPCLWSQTIMIGNPEPLKRIENYNKRLIAIIGGILSILFIILFLRFRNSFRPS